ncbi:hypothetical protein [Oceanobacillus massiliensis]|uniref:hypothetical protein n=1 Tax=Oceanobacillus massiliensis TaxID=1465765 RepID=UPI0002898989|nr:hypothetical protein [Oceanobacillus massiliensis]
MIKNRLLLILLLFIAAGCSDSTQPIIEKVDTVPYDSNREPALIEQQEEEEIEQYIEFSLFDEQVLINLEMVPILNEYLKGVQDEEAAINEMKLEKLPLSEHQIYLMEFSCINDLCSYLLFNQNGENPAYLVADLAKTANTLISPDQTKIALHFSRINGKSEHLDNLVVVDLQEWKLSAWNNEPDGANILNYTWPFVAVEWLDDTTLTVRRPDILEPTSASISEWQELGGTKLISTHLHIAD